LHTRKVADKERLLYLRPNTIQLLAEYTAKEQPTGYLFPSRQNDQVSVLTLREQFRAYVKQAGLAKRITPHALRHSIAVHYLLGGAPITFVQQLLGHASLATTGIYTRLTDAMTKDIALKTSTGMDSEKETKRSEVLKEERGEYYGPSEWSTWVDVALVENLPT
jgi:integrase/recombinase XerD